MSNTRWGRTFSRSLNRYCSHGADFDRLGTLHWPNDIHDQQKHVHWPNNVQIFWEGRFVITPVTSFAGRVATWVESSAIVFVNIVTNVLSACVAVARFTSAMVWSCCISVNNAALACVDFTLAAYPSVSEVLEDLRVSLNTLVKQAFKLLQVLSSLCLRDHSRKSSWYSSHFWMIANGIETIWAGVYRLCTATDSWFHSIRSMNSSKIVSPEIGSFILRSISWMLSSSSSAYSVIRWVKIWKHVTFVKPMIQLDKYLYYLSGINCLITFLHAQSTAWYLLNKQILCLWVLTSLEKIATVGAGSGMTGWMSGFVVGRNAVPQWVLNTNGFAVRTG